MHRAAWVASSFAHRASGQLPRAPAAARSSSADPTFAAAFRFTPTFTRTRRNWVFSDTPALSIRHPRCGYAGFFDWFKSKLTVRPTEIPPELLSRWHALLQATSNETRIKILTWILKYENEDLYQLLDEMGAQEVLSELVWEKNERVQQLAFYLLLETEYQLLMENDEAHLPGGLGKWVRSLPMLAQRATCPRVMALASAAHDILTQEMELRDPDDVGADVDESFFPAFIDTFLQRLPPAGLDQLLDILHHREPMHQPAWDGDASEIRKALCTIMNSRGLLGFAALVLETDRDALASAKAPPDV